MTTGRNFDEILRVLDSMQLTAGYPVATPVNWKSGEDVIIVPAVSDEEAKEKFPEGWKTIKPLPAFCKATRKAKITVHYRKMQIATFDAPVEMVFEYMSAGNHHHQAFKEPPARWHFRQCCNHSGGALQPPMVQLFKQRSRID